MESKGYVSIWLGNFASLDDLMSYATDDVTDEDNIYSQFAIDFFDIKENGFDPDFWELGVYEPSDRLAALVNQSSNGYSFEVEGIILEKEYNAVILIYDFKYDMKTDINATVDFIAAVPYKKINVDF